MLQKSAAVVLDDMKIFVVDDSPDSVRVIKAMLQQIGIQKVFTANNGQEALNFLAISEELGDKIDAILCDWHMPGMTGLEVLRQFRSVDAHTPFVMITGARDYESITEAKAAGVTAYIGKPFSAEELQKKMTLLARLRNRSDVA
jgi:two-component system, chemotaxis family, chemotaxis protein CheY